MKIKITLERPAGEIDLVLTADADATVGDVADALATRDPEHATPGRRRQHAHRDRRRTYHPRS